MPPLKLATSKEGGDGRKELDGSHAVAIADLGETALVVSMTTEEKHPASTGPIMRSLQSSEQLLAETLLPLKPPTSEDVSVASTEFDGSYSVAVVDSGETVVVISRTAEEKQPSSTSDSFETTTGVISEELDVSEDSPVLSIQRVPDFSSVISLCIVKDEKVEKSFDTICEPAVVCKEQATVVDLKQEGLDAKQKGRASHIELNGLHRKRTKRSSSLERETSDAHNMTEPPSKVAQDTTSKMNLKEGASFKDRVVISKDIAGKEVELASLLPVNANVLQAVSAKTGTDTQQNPLKKNAELLDALKELVQGPGPKGLRNTREGDASERKKIRDGDDCVRTRKIMRRGADANGKVSVIVEQIQQQLREAAGPGAYNGSGKMEVTDERFFAAFKAAMVKTCGHDLPTRNRAFTLGLQNSKKVTFSKGGSRENLTRKLYGGSGKRRQAWDRDWDIAFWKERASNTKKAKKEKEEILERHLGLDRENFEKAIFSSKESIKDDVDPIFTRLYPADASLLPRKDDIKSLAVQLNDKKDSATLKPPLKECQIKARGVFAKSVAAHEIADAPLDAEDSRNIGSTNNRKILKAENKETCMMVDNTSSLSSSIITGELQETSKSKNTIASAGNPDPKNDKRKWALEVLARKTGTMVNNRAASGTGGSSMERESLPLLVQIPMEMRPVLEYDRRSKVPTATRQTQLNRFVEHYLQRANIKTVTKNPECEGAILAAVNKENEIYEKSNSKGVYINLCVQLLCHSENKDMDQTRVVSQPLPDTKSKDVIILDSETNDAVDRALKVTGLISDSPPGSPLCQQENKNSSPASEGKSIFDLEDDPSLDIYRDFEFELEDFESGESVFEKKLNPEVKRVSQLDLKAAKVQVLLTTANKIDSFQSVSSDSPAVFQQDLRGAESGGGKLGKLQMEGEACEISEDTCNEQKLLSRSIVQFTNKEEYQETSNSHDLGNARGLNNNEGEVNGQTLKSSVNQAGSRKEDNRVKSSPRESAVCKSRDDLASDFENRIEKNRTDFEHISSQPELLSGRSDLSTAGGSQRHDLATNRTSPTSVRTSKNGAPAAKEALPSDTTTQAVWKQLEKFVKEHIRPLHRSGVVTTEQYQWAVAKTTNKVMQHHAGAKSADFLIVEGEKVKRLAEQYLKSFKQRKC